MGHDIKKLSKGTPSLKDGVEPGMDAYKLSCLMRIADASEAMAANYNSMKRERDNYERWYHDYVEKNKKLEASNASLRGVITRMKNKEKIQKETGA